MCARKRKCVSLEPGLELYVLLSIFLSFALISLCLLQLPRFLLQQQQQQQAHCAMLHKHTFTLCVCVSGCEYYTCVCLPLRTLHLSPSLPHLLPLCCFLSPMYCMHMYIYMRVCVCVIRTFRAAFWHLKFSRSYSGAEAFSSLPVPVPNFLCVTRPHFSKANVVRVRVVCVCVACVI